jgi:hypothetical protein
MMDLLPYMELSAALYLVHIIFIINAHTFWYKILYYIIPLVLALSLTFDAVTRLGWVVKGVTG